jgi:hypothetical protein
MQAMRSELQLHPALVFGPEARPIFVILKLSGAVASMDTSCYHYFRTKVRDLKRANPNMLTVFNLTLRAAPSFPFWCRRPLK